MNRCHLFITNYQPAIICGIFLSALSFGSNIAMRAQDSAPKDAKTTAAAPKQDAGDTSAARSPRKHHKANGAGGGGGGHHHDRVPAKRQVMSLTSLTDKQKQQISAVYTENEEQFKSLNKQMFELKMSEWKKIQPVLTKDQLSELGAAGQAGGTGNAADDAGASGDKAPSK